MLRGRVCQFPLILKNEAYINEQIERNSNQLQKKQTKRSLCAEDTEKLEKNACRRALWAKQKKEKNLKCININNSY